MKYSKEVVNGFVLIDLILIFGYFMFPALAFIHPIFGSLDELCSVYFLTVVIFKSFVLKIGNKYFQLTLLFYLLYSVFLIFKNHLPYSHVLQIMITSKFAITFLFFAYKSKQYKLQFMPMFIKYIAVIFVISLFISVLQFIVPGYFKTAVDERGLNGITLGGIFFSRTLYSAFLVSCITIIMTLKSKENKLEKFIVENKNKLVAFCLFLILLTFTRKDFLFGLMIAFYLYSLSAKGIQKRIIQITFVLGFAAIPILSNTLFADVNKKTFTDRQVRLTILVSGLRIYNYYAPLGSGPGTFGSIMSIGYTDIYRKFNVPQHVYRGFGDQAMGPIFDVFIISLLVEYGVGVVFFILFYFMIYRAKREEELDSFLEIRHSKKMFLIYIFLASMTVPVLNNSTGMMLFAFMGITSLSYRKNEYTKTDRQLI